MHAVWVLLSGACISVLLLLAGLTWKEVLLIFLPFVLILIVIETLR